MDLSCFAKASPICLIRVASSCATVPKFSMLQVVQVMILEEGG